MEPKAPEVGNKLNRYAKRDDSSYREAHLLLGRRAPAGLRGGAGTIALYGA